MHPFLGVLRLGEGERVFGSYGAMVGLGVLVAGALAIRAAHRARLDVGAAFAALALTVGGGFFGAWLTFLLVEWARTGSPVSAFYGGGFVFFGAVPGGALGLWSAGRWLKLDVLAALDLSAPGLAAGHALGRLGCFLGGCCYGAPFSGPWAVTYTHPFAPGAHPPVPRHPTPVYEAAGLVLIALVLALLPIRRPGTGARAALYLAAYCALRLVVEAFRGDRIRGVWLGGMSTSQGIALLGLVVAAGLALRAHRGR
ncbi:MAG: prolipoprotein diacylglyceryl transferase [Sandaracinaceae bacterium]